MSSNSSGKSSAKQLSTGTAPEFIKGVEQLVK